MNHYIILNTNIYHSPFGSPLRKYNFTDMNVGFNGKRMDNELSVEGGHLDFGARIYDSRIGKWLAPDPYEKMYSDQSPYNFALNSPIIFVDADGNVVEPGILLSPKQLSKLKTILRTMTKEGMFLQVYRLVSHSSQRIIVDKVGATEYGKLMAEQGDFTASRDVKEKLFGFVKENPGTKGNEHRINLVSAIKNKANGFDEGTVFEEFFHAAQYINNPNNSNNLQIETEAKVAKVFQFYQKAGDDFKDYNHSTFKDFGVGAYELNLLFDFEEGTNIITGFNQDVLAYFKAIDTGAEISEEMESKFRAAVVALGERVKDNYQEKFWGGKKFEFEGETPLFDKLVKEKKSKKPKSNEKGKIQKTN